MTLCNLGFYEYQPLKCLAFSSRKSLRVVNKKHAIIFTSLIMVLSSNCVFTDLSSCKQTIKIIGKGLHWGAINSGNYTYIASLERRFEKIKIILSLIPSTLHQKIWGYTLRYSEQLIHEVGNSFLIQPDVQS